MNEQRAGSGDTASYMAPGPLAVPLIFGGNYALFTYL